MAYNLTFFCNWIMNRIGSCALQVVYGGDQDGGQNYGGTHTLRLQIHVKTAENLVTKHW